MNICIYHHYNNMCANNAATKDELFQRRSPENQEYSDNYETDSEPIGAIKSDSASVSMSEDKCRSQKSAQSNVTVERNTANRGKTNSKFSRGKKSKLSFPPVKPPIVKRRGPQSLAFSQQNAVDRWESAQLALAEANSQNASLQRQLQECRTELRTVQRQCKMQSARLNKAIGQEADLPQIVDRLTMDIRSLQVRLRDKTQQFEASQRRISDLQHRILVLEKESEERQNLLDQEEIHQKIKTEKPEEMAAELQSEKKKSAALQHQLEVISRSHRHQTAIANEQVRHLRRVCRDLESQLAEKTLALQEKMKLLELQNIYCRRLPQHIPAHLPPPKGTEKALTDHSMHLGMHKERSEDEAPVKPGLRKVSVSLGRARTRRDPNVKNNSVISSESFGQSFAQTNEYTPEGTTIPIDASLPPTVESSTKAVSLIHGDNSVVPLALPSDGSYTTAEARIEHSSDTGSQKPRPEPESLGAGVNDQSLYETQVYNEDSPIVSYGEKDEYENMTVLLQANVFCCISDTASSDDGLRSKQCHSTEREHQSVPRRACVSQTDVQIDQVGMMASQQQRPLDVTLATQGLQVEPKNQPISLCLDTDIEAELKERERKNRLLQTLQELDEMPVLKPSQESENLEIQRKVVSEQPLNNKKSISSNLSDTFNKWVYFCIY
ncbi:unnamed protein product [Calicophoron daubneyi]|uniref:Lebercilin domain-containing protein n=1 Tax=Calicophoron daubneyi TaxID=300641 RepID=A0AAV2TJN6_CALDB